MNKDIRLWAAVLALCLALSLGLGGCAPKNENKTAASPAREGVSTYGAGENLAPDGSPLETVYVPGILEFDRSLQPITRFQTSPNGLYAFDEMAQKFYEFDGEGRCLREWSGDYADYEALADPVSSTWRLEAREDRAARATDYRVLRLEDGQESTVLSFRCENGTATLVGLEEGFLLYRFGWDENGVDAFTLESYDAAGQLLQSRDLGEWMEIYRTGDGLYFFGFDSRGFYRYDPADFSLTRVDSVPEDFRVCGFQGGAVSQTDVLYLTDYSYLYRHRLGSGENEPLFRYDALFLSEGVAPVPIGGTESFFFLDLRNESSPFRIAVPVAKSSFPAEKKILTLAINEIIPEEKAPHLQYGSFHDEILDFNTVNREYEIVVRNYADCPDPFLALSADLAGGNAPDIIDVRGFGSAICSPAAAEDLLPYVQRDLGTDALLSGPLAAMITDGKLLSLMPSFSLVAILGPASLLDGREIESFSALSDLAGGAERVFDQSLDRESFLLWVFANSRRDYTADQAEDLLRFAAALPEDNMQIPEGLTEQEYREALAHGTVFPVDYGPIRDGLQRFQLALIADPLGRTLTTGAASIPETEGWLGERVSALGLPGTESSGIYLAPTRELMIPQAAANKEGAWAFLSFVLSDRYLVRGFTGSFSYGIPLTRAAYDRGMAQYEIWMDGQLSGTVNGMDYELRYDPENAKALFLALLDEVEGVCRDGDELYTAVRRTAEAYFSGDKAMEQAASEIARQLRIYHAEQGQ